MFTAVDMRFIMLCLEGFFYGNISVLCALTCTFTNEVQLFPGLGLYSGIFAIYLHCPLRESRTSTIIFYVLCLLYVLSAATVVVDLLTGIFEVSNNSICKKKKKKISVMQIRINRLSPQLQIHSVILSHGSPCDCPNIVNG